MGPDASVILGRPLTGRARRELDDMIRSVSTRRTAGQFFVRTTVAVGGSYEREPWEEDWPFEVTVAERAEGEEGGRLEGRGGEGADKSTDGVHGLGALSEAAFGFRPGHSIRLSA